MAEDSQLKLNGRGYESLHKWMDVSKASCCIEKEYRFPNGTHQIMRQPCTIIIGIFSTRSYS